VKVAPRRSRRRSRTLWGALDQGVSSLITLALTIAVARGVDPREFGFFSIALMISTIVLSLTRTLASDPLTIRFSARNQQALHLGAKGSLSSSAAVGVGLGVIMAATGVALGGAVGGALVAFGASAPFVALQDGCRMAFVAMGRPRATLSIDLIWLSVQGVGIVLWTLSGREGSIAYVGAWGLGAAASAFAGLRRLRVFPTLRSVGPWLRAHRDLSSPLMLDQLTMLAGSQATTWAVGAIVGVASLGAMRVVQVVLGPITTIFTAVSLVAVPELVRITQENSVARAKFVAARLSTALAALAICAGAAVWLLPAEVGRSLFGESWLSATGIVIPMTFVIAATGAQTGWIIAARALELATGMVRARLRTALLTAAFGVVGAVVGELHGAVIGMAGAGWIGVACWWREVAADRGCCPHLDDRGTETTAQRDRNGRSAGVKEVSGPGQVTV